MTTTTDNNHQQVFILITIENTYIKVLKPLSPFPSFIFDIISLSSSNKYVEQRVDKKIEKQVPRI